MSYVHQFIRPIWIGDIYTFDFSSACPSVLLQWIFLVLRWLGMPTGLYNFFSALYHEVYCFLVHAGQKEFMCQVRSGVLQGCPLAALLFVMTMEPFVLLFQKQIMQRELGTVSLCADDIAIVIKNLYDLIVVYIIFLKAQFAAGLTLNSTKCVIVPLSAPVSPPLSKVYRIL